MALNSEFSIIQHYFEQLTASRDDVDLGIGDDCALLKCPAGQSIAVTMDTLIEGIHFFADVDPQTLGHKSLAVSLSDLAAMGAKPAWFTLAITLPDINERWLEAFCKGLSTLANEHNIQLVGGDTTRGPLAITIQAHGLVEDNKALTRGGAKQGDAIFVTGSLGDAGAALHLKLKQWDDANLSVADKDYLYARLDSPCPRNEMGQALIGIASSAIDISDGLLADLGHITEKSGVGARLDLKKLPFSNALSKINRTMSESLALESGDDYELCFTVPSNRVAEVEQQFKGQCTQIGMISDDDGIYFLGENDELIHIGSQKVGYDHFKE
jgi:thiamine-monophosphate kinase